MDGIILFADDQIFNIERNENKLFRKFNSDSNFSVLPIDSLNVLEKAILSISTYRALILDWNFKRQLDSEDDDVSIPDETPFELLKRCQIYSLVYVYSLEPISEITQTELKTLYPDKIFFEQKTNSQNVEMEYEKIITGIKRFEEENKHMHAPFVWSQAINKSAQIIFQEFENADKYWITELFYSSVRNKDKDGKPTVKEAEPTTEVINLFQNILSERLLQNPSLREVIYKYAIENQKENTNIDSIKALYSKIYYTKTLETDAIMTGDVYKLSEEEYGIIISPECDMIKLIKKNEMIGALCFTKDSFKNISNFCKKEKDEIIRAYNQDISAIHLFPIFPFDGITQTALIDFRFSLKLFESKFFEENKDKRLVKINSPYIQQLRQRYLTYLGRVGVPAIPQSLRLFNLIY